MGCQPESLMRIAYATSIATFHALQIAKNPNLVLALGLHSSRVSAPYSRNRVAVVNLEGVTSQKIRQQRHIAGLIA